MWIDWIVILLLLLYFGYLAYRLIFKRDVGGCNCRKRKHLKKMMKDVRKDLKL